MDIDLKTSPLFLANMNTDKKIRVNEGGTRCFAPNTRVVTPTGDKLIKDIVPGDMVRCCDTSVKVNTWKIVTATHSMKNTKPTVRIKLKNGRTITATEDHLFWFKGGWRSLKKILSLWDERNMANNTKL